MTEKTVNKSARSESPEQLLPHFEFFDPDDHLRSAEVLEYARRECPVAHTSALGGHYIAAGYEPAAQILSDPETFSSVGYTNIVGNGGVVIPPIDTDPPMHRHFRALLNPFFHPKRVAEDEARMRELARQHMAPWIESGECEFIGDFAGPFVADVLAKLVFEAEDPDLFHEAAALNDRIAEGDTSAYPLIWELIVGFVERHDGTGPGIMPVIKNGTVDGRPLTYEEQVGTTLILFQGGLDTTKVAISDILLALTQRPEMEERLRTPGWEKSVLDELIRFSSPVAGLGRVATRDVTIGGQDLHVGDRVLVHYASANRDSAVFDRADDLDFDRARNPHLGFGLGVHRCLGIHLARAQVTVAITELLARITGVALVQGARLERRPGFSPVLLDLPLRFKRR